MMRAFRDAVHDSSLAAAVKCNRAQLFCCQLAVNRADPPPFATIVPNSGDQRAKPARFASCDAPRLPQHGDRGAEPASSGGMLPKHEWWCNGGEASRATRG